METTVTVATSYTISERTNKCIRLMQELHNLETHTASMMNEVFDNVEQNNEMFEDIAAAAAKFGEVITRIITSSIQQRIVEQREISDI